MFRPRFSPANAVCAGDDQVAKWTHKRLSSHTDSRILRDWILASEYARQSATAGPERRYKFPIGRILSEPFFGVHRTTHWRTKMRLENAPRRSVQWDVP
jgi:peptidoglycan/xylan/chitin deacetylase (PgdA/CDA1 family)